jgi:hypothetical protein
MANPAGESNAEVLRLDFNRRLMLQFRGSVIPSDAGLLAYRGLDAALGLITMAGDILADARTGKNGRHALVGTRAPPSLRPERVDPAPRSLRSAGAVLPRPASRAETVPFSPSAATRTASSEASS